MPRPTSKGGLLAAAHQEFEHLSTLVDGVEIADREIPGCCAQWSVKDVLAHLDAWHELLLGWLRVADSGEQPVIPAPGFTWKDTPALNQAIFERARGDTWADVELRLRQSHAAVLSQIERYDEHLFTKRQFARTGSTSVGAYFVSATSSHYTWASTLVRKWAKRRAAAKRDVHGG